MPRPRKKGSRHIYRITLRLWEGEDDDLIAFLDAIAPGKRVRAVKQAMRGGNLAVDRDDEIDDDDLFDLVDGLLM